MALPLARHGRIGRQRKIQLLQNWFAISFKNHQMSRTLFSRKKYCTSLKKAQYMANFYCNLSRFVSDWILSDQSKTQLHYFFPCDQTYHLYNNIFEVRQVREPNTTSIISSACVMLDCDGELDSIWWLFPNALFVNLKRGQVLSTQACRTCRMYFPC